MAKVECEIEETTIETDDGRDIDSIRATCSRCGHVTESYGTSERSVKRCLVLMRDECPEAEDNYYVEEGESDYE